MIAGKSHNTNSKVKTLNDLERRVIFNWSGGKDSAFCLYKILHSREYDVMCLLTSISEQYQRISMHGIRVELLDTQAKSIGLPLVKMQIPEIPTMESYESVLTAHLKELIAKGATGSVFGDIFLEDLREYREKKLAEIGLNGIFPLWKIPTDQLIRDFIDAGFKTIVTCVNEKHLDKSFAGRIIDHDFLRDLPANVDPCGENGEYHSFVFDGPIFKHPVPFEKGEVVFRKYEAPKESDSSSDCFQKEEKRDDPYAFGFYYCDLLLQNTNTQ